MGLQLINANNKSIDDFNHKNINENANFTLSMPDLRVYVGSIFTSLNAQPIESNKQ